MLYSCLQFYIQAKKVTDEKISQQHKNLTFIQDSFTPLLISENFDQLKISLDKAKDLNLINFYIIQKNKDVIAWYNNFDNLAGINVDYQNFNVLMQNDQLAFRTVKIQDLKFTVGVFQDQSKILWATAWILRASLITDMLIVTSAVGLIAYLFLKDIINLSRVLTSRSRSDIAKIRTQSAEGTALLKASMGLEGERVRLEKLSESYGETVGPAIKYELNTGKEAPYNFQATMCRIDLNGYTQMFLEKDPRYIIEILNTYFARARSIIERYDGLIYQFVGDEIVFQFKDDISSDLSTEALAAACIRDLFQAASDIEQNLPPEADHYFKLKGSFAKGLMRFIKLDEGHALSGLPLIESVRLLSLIDDKSHQVLTFFQEALTSTDGLVFVFERKTNQLKGFKEESQICRARDFNSIAWALETECWDQLAYFRSDEHLLFVLKKIRLMAVTKREEDIFNILRALRFHHFEQTSPAIIAEIELVLAHFIHSEEEKLLSPRALSSLLSLVQRVVPKAQATQDITASISKLLYHTDYRVQANAIATLGRYNYPARKLWEKMYSPNNRVAADTIIEVGKQCLNDDVIKALNRLLDSSDSRNYKSGEYAKNQLLKYYQETDPVFFEANTYIAQIRQKNAA